MIIGILQKATDAKTQTGVGQEKETIALAYNSALAKKVSNGNSSAVTDRELNDELDSNEATASGNPIVVTFTKSGNAYEIDSNGIIKPSTPKDPNASNLTVAELNAIEANNTANPTDQIEEITSSVTNTNLTDSTKIKAVLTGNVPIPVGANYIEGTVDTGVVIEYKGSQFVWVPVPVTDNNSLYPKGTTKAMAKISSGTDYEGILYDFGRIDFGPTGQPSWIAYDDSRVMSEQGTTGYRETDILSDYDIDDINPLKERLSNYGESPDSLTQTYLATIGLTQEEFQDEMQENYNKMIQSVLLYGGFFVGRYETSLDNTTTVSSRVGTPMNSTMNNQMWYGMYDKQKKFTNNTDVMTSSMIWGSQYDAMLNWMLVGTESEYVNSTERGNHSGNTTNTGGTITDKINNIYDLEGNLLEWTLEANNTSNRVCRRRLLWIRIFSCYS